MRQIGVVTTSRAEYGIIRSVLRQIVADDDLRLLLYVGGTHLSPDYGCTVDEIEYPITDRIECLMSSDSPQGIGKSMALTMSGFAQAFERTRPDILLVTGDRYEMLAAAAVAVPFKIPIAHLDGGALTYGAFDEQWRHAMTKLSHLHFCYIDENAARVRQMGEESWRVTVTGNPALDGIVTNGIWQQFCKDNIHVTPETILVVFHSTTMEYERTEEYTDNLLAALKRFTHPVIMIMPNADTGGHVIIRKMRHFANENSKRVTCHANLWPDVFRALMKFCCCMVGNSSAGIMEAASFKLPVVNIGNRQAGRMRPRNVIQVGYSASEIERGINSAMEIKFKTGLNDLTNPYGDGQSAERIVSILKNTVIDERLLIKRWA